MRIFGSRRTGTGIGASAVEKAKEGRGNSHAFPKWQICHGNVSRGRPWKIFHSAIRVCNPSQRGFSVFGRIERKILWSAFKQPFGQWVPLPPEDFCDRDAAYRASKSLEAIGLIQRTTIDCPYTYPRRARMHVKLTAIGREFCDTYSAPLQSGARLTLRIFERRTGITFPSKRKAIPSWLRPGNNPNPASNPSPGKTAPPTAA